VGRLGVAALVLLLVVLGLRFAQQSWQRSRERSAAFALIEQRDYTSALAALRQCLEREPDDPELLQAVVGALVQNGAGAGDIEAYAKRWCEADPENPAAFRARREALHRLTRFDEAAAAGERVLALSPHDHDSRLSLGDLYLQTGRWDDAAREYRRLLADRPDLGGEVAPPLARAEMERGNRAEAARLLDQVLETAPDHPVALVFRGIVCFRNEEFREAVELFRKCRPASISEQQLVLYHMALALGRLGQSKESEAVFAQLSGAQEAARYAEDANQRPDDLSLQVKAARACLAAGNPEAARARLETALKRLGPSKHALELLASCYDALGRGDLAGRTRDEARRAP
jgi:tetratricopeptide (TPR) repeat protein